MRAWHLLSDHGILRTAAASLIAASISRLTGTRGKSQSWFWQAQEARTKGQQRKIGMGWAACLRASIVLFLAAAAIGIGQQAFSVENERIVPAGRLMIEGKRLSCGSTKTLLRDFQGFAVSSTVIMLNMQALKDLPRQVQWLIYYHECGHILFGPSETSADCYAIKRATREGWLNEQGLDEICAVFNIAGHGPVHPDPEVRCNQLRQCFVKKGVTARGDR
jgi:hypothetical protein